MPPRFIAEQLANPHGFRGWLVRRGMNRGNAAANAFAMEQLDLRGTDDVLEVGFGGGPNLDRILGLCRSIVGVDRSNDAVSEARRRFGEEGRKGRAEFLLGTVEALPLTDGAVDKALTVHTVYFWTDVAAAFEEFHRCLRPGGRLVIGFVPKERMDLMGMPADVFTPREPQDLRKAAEIAGFMAEVRTPDARAPYLALVGLKVAGNRQ